ncbi:MAG: hypothetical protein KDA79_01360 [Planctomycetaceae bacterium]|nr:hypothetical protein [Planctomycetaceae bacterium]
MRGSTSTGASAGRSGSTGLTALSARHQLLLDRAVLPLFLLWTVLLGCTAMQNFDIWWHLATGRWIVAQGFVPYTDVFTFTGWDRPWVDLHWGFQLLVLALHGLGGVPLLVLSKALCLGLTSFLLWHAAGSRQLLPAWGRALCWSLPVICLSGRSVVRPEMLSLVLLALWLWIVSRLAERPRLIWLLPVVQLVWVNCHGLFVLGLVVGGVWLTDQLARGLAAGRWGIEPVPETGPEARTILRVAVLTGLACLLNPYFEEGLLFPLVLYRKFSVDQQLYAGIGEFQRPFDFLLKYGLANVYLTAQLLLALAAAASFLPLWWHRRLSVFRLLLFAAFSLLGWKASRNTTVFATVAGFVLAANLNEILRLRRSNRPQHISETADSPGGASSTGLPVASAVCVAGLLLLTALVASGHWARWSGEKGPPSLQARPYWYAHEAAIFAGQPGMPERAFIAHEGQAAVYLFHNGPQKLVFMDGRLEVASRETFQLYNSLKQMMATGDLRWQSLLRDSEGRLPLLLFDSRFSRAEISALMQTPGWRLVFADVTAAVFVDDSLATRLGLPSVSPEPLLHPPPLMPAD